MFHVLTAGIVLTPSFHRAFLDENEQFWLASVRNDIWLTINSVIRLAAGGSGNAGGAGPAQLSCPSLRPSQSFTSHRSSAAHIAECSCFEPMEQYPYALSWQECRDWMENKRRGKGITRVASCYPQLLTLKSYSFSSSVWNLMENLFMSFKNILRTAFGVLGSGLWGDGDASSATLSWASGKLHMFPSARYFPAAFCLACRDFEVAFLWCLIFIMHSRRS